MDDSYCENVLFSAGIKILRDEAPDLSRVECVKVKYTVNGYLYDIRVVQPLHSRW